MSFNHPRNPLKDGFSARPSKPRTVKRADNLVMWGDILTLIAIFVFIILLFFLN